MVPYGSQWRARRRLCHEALNERLSGSFDSHQYKYTCRFLSSLLEEPKHFMQEVELYVVSHHSHPIQPLTYLPTPEACLEPSYCPQPMGSTSSRAKIHFSRHPSRRHVRLWLLRYPENSSSILSLCVHPGVPEQHPQATDGTLDSTVSSRLVPGDRVQGSCQKITRQVSNSYQQSHGIC